MWHEAKLYVSPLGLEHHTLITELGCIDSLSRTQQQQSCCQAAQQELWLDCATSESMKMMFHCFAAVS